MPSLVQILASRLFGAKPFSEQMLFYNWFDPWGPISTDYILNWIILIQENAFKSVVGKGQPLYFGFNMLINQAWRSDALWRPESWSTLGSDNGLVLDNTKSLREPVSTYHDMMTSSNGDNFRVTGLLCGEFTGPRWIPHTNASDAELWCPLRSASE